MPKTLSRDSCLNFKMGTDNMPIDSMLNQIKELLIYDARIGHWFGVDPMAEKYIETLEKQLKISTGKLKKKLNEKILKIRKNAEKKSKGETYWGR